MKKLFPLFILSCFTIHLKAQSKFEREKNLLDSISVSLNLKKNDPFMYGIKGTDNSSKQFVGLDMAKEGSEFDSCLCVCYCSYIAHKGNPDKIYLFSIDELHSDNFRMDAETLFLPTKNSKGKNIEIPISFGGMTQGVKIKNWLTELSLLCKE